MFIRTSISQTAHFRGANVSWSIGESWAELISTDPGLIYGVAPQERSLLRSGSAECGGLSPLANERSRSRSRRHCSSKCSFTRRSSAGVQRCGARNVFASPSWICAPRVERERALFYGTVYSGSGCAMIRSYGHSAQKACVQWIWETRVGTKLSTKIKH